MSYNPSREKTALYAAYLTTSAQALPSLAPPSQYEFLFDAALGACKINSNNKIECDYKNSITSCDITTGSINYNIFNYGFTNGTYRTASHIRNQYSKGDDCAVGVHINNNIIKVDTGILFRLSGGRNQDGLDQLAGVII